MTWVERLLRGVPDTSVTCRHDPQDPTRTCCATDRDSDPRLLVELSVSVEICYVVAANPSTPPKILADIALSVGAGAEVTAARANAAMNPSTPVEALVAIATIAGSDARWAVACNPALPLDVLERFYVERDSRVLAGVARNPKTRPEVLGRLAEHPERDVRRGVAENPSTPGEVLTSLASVSSVRYGVAGNPSTPPEVLRALHAEVGDRELFWFLATNPAIPDDVLLSMPVEMVCTNPRWLALVDQLPEAAQQIVRALVADEVAMSGQELLDAVRRLAGP